MELIRSRLLNVKRLLENFKFESIKRLHHWRLNIQNFKLIIQDCWNFTCQSKYFIIQISEFIKWNTAAELKTSEFGKILKNENQTFKKCLKSF